MTTKAPIMKELYWKKETVRLIERPWREAYIGQSVYMKANAIFEGAPCGKVLLISITEEFVPLRRD